MENIKIGGKKLGTGCEVFVIAEIGSNHDGDFGKALAMIDAAAEAGADAVKFQSFSGDGLVNPEELPEARELLERIKTPARWLPELKARCEGRGVVFISTPFEMSAVDDLEGVGVEAYKIASGDVTYLPLVARVAETGKPILMSVGACSPDEIERAVAAIKDKGNARIILLQCVPLYPAETADAGVAAMVALCGEFGVHTGYSDHTMGEAAALAAAANGAVAYERHFTLNRGDEGPDHSFAIQPEELADLIKKMKAVTAAMGVARKVVSEKEMAIRHLMRRGVYAAVDIPAGTPIEMRMLKFVRPQKGAGPEDIEKIVGRRTITEIRKNRPVDIENIT